MICLSDVMRLRTELIEPLELDEGLRVNTSFLLFTLLRKMILFFICRKETFVHVLRLDLGATTLLKKL